MPETTTIRVDFSFAMRSSIWERDRWLCNTETQLESALREYRDAEEDADGNGTEEGEREDQPDRRYRIYAQNRVIDQAMRAIRPEHPKEWHLLKGYYIWELWKDINRGWHDTGKMLGWNMPECQKYLRCRTANDDRYQVALCDNGEDCPALKAKFLELNTAAVKVLLHAVQRRQ
jgi:hypothetical protein